MAKTLSIVQINDTHANLLPHGDAGALYRPGLPVETLGGYPRIMTKIKEYREKYPNEVLVLDNGDTLHGSYGGGGNQGAG